MLFGQLLLFDLVWSSLQRRPQGFPHDGHLRGAALLSMLLFSIGQSDSQNGSAVATVNATAEVFMPPQAQHLRGGGSNVASDWPSDVKYIVIGSVFGFLLAFFVIALLAVVCMRYRRLNHPFSSSSSSKRSQLFPLEASGERKLAQSAQMFHYQHQKQQLIALENAQKQSNSSQNQSEMDLDVEEDDSIYEYPGLARGTSLEVKNPIFATESNDLRKSPLPPSQ